MTSFDAKATILAQMQPNEEQQPAVLARGRDVVVTAGAGTGKTRTLVARYLSLLAEGVSLRSIVAITFTRKAAQEMRNRIRGEIRDYLEGDLPKEERERWDELYNLLDAARIGTIHELSTEILRAHPAEASVDPRFNVLDEAQSGILLTQAIETALAWAADDDEVVSLYSEFGEWRLRSVLVDLMQKRLDAAGAFANLPNPLWPAWERQLAGEFKAFVDDGHVRAAFSDLILLRTGGILDRAEAEGDKLAAPLRQLLELWDEILAARVQDDWVAVSACLLPLRQNLVQAGRKAAWQPADPKIIIGELQSLYDEKLSGLTGKGKNDTGINLDQDRRLAGLMPALQQLFLQALRTYERFKQDRQALDFDDLEDKALGLLRDNPAVRARWQKEVVAILVDEYQDTNGRQRDLVNLINGGGSKLFIVGDAKQSIYRFRGADVAVFRGERAQIEAAGGSGYTLAKSYRSHRDLLLGLNDLLKPVLGEVDDPERPWREPFAPLTHHRETPLEGITAPFVALQLTVGSKSDGALDRAARALAGYLVTLVEESGSEASYGDVAILCRASTSFGAYEDALNEAGVPYLTVAGRGFFERPEVRDLLNGMRALSDPTDDLALVGLLRSPVFGFSDAELYDLGRQWRAAVRQTSLWHFMQGVTGDRSESTVATIARLHKKAGRMPVADLLKAFLDETDYRAALLQAGQARSARNVSKLLADAHASGIVGVGEFLAYVEEIGAGAAREGEARATAGNVVRIMSVHAAKGLEFPVVVLGDINYRGRGRNDLLLDPEFGVLLPFSDDDGAMPGIYRLGLERHQDQEAAESDRLLYVAATRAQDKLILNGAIKLSRDKRPGWMSGWLKQLAGPLNLTGQAVDYDEDGGRAVPIDLQVGQTPAGCTIYEPGYEAQRSQALLSPDMRPDGDWPPPLLDEVAYGSRQVDEGMQAEERDPPLRVWRVVPEVQRPRASAWLVGVLVHEALAQWRFPGQTSDFDDWVEARARTLGLSDRKRLADAVNQTNTLLRRFQSDDLYRALDGAERRLHEVPYSLMGRDGTPEHGTIDALYLSDGQWTVVDFKSDRDPVRSGKMPGYEDQLRRYATAVERLLDQRPRVILCLLNYQGYVDWREVSPG